MSLLTISHVFSSYPPYFSVAYPSGRKSVAQKEVISVCMPTLQEPKEEDTLRKGMKNLVKILFVHNSVSLTFYYIV